MRLISTYYTVGINGAQAVLLMHIVSCRDSDRKLAGWNFTGQERFIVQKTVCGIDSSSNGSIDTESKPLMVYSLLRHR